MTATHPSGTPTVPTADGTPDDSLSARKRSAGGPATLSAAGAGVLALLSASCCVLPLALGLAGVGGSWLVLLGPFVAWRTPILIGTVLVIAFAWWTLGRRGLDRVRPRLLVVAGLASVSLALAISAPLWEREATAFLIDRHMDALRSRTTAVPSVAVMPSTAPAPAAPPARPGSVAMPEVASPKVTSPKGTIR